MRLVERASGSCFELELHGTRLLLDFGGAGVSCAPSLLRYVPQHRPEAPSGAAVGEAVGAAVGSRVEGQ